MRAAMYYNNKDIRIEDVPVPEIGPGELLMRVEASGICGSDVLEWYRLKKAPLVLGHEVAGQVVKVGEGVFVIICVPVGVSLGLGELVGVVVGVQEGVVGGVKEGVVVGEGAGVKVGDVVGDGVSVGDGVGGTCVGDGDGEGVCVGDR